MRVRGERLALLTILTVAVGSRIWFASISAPTDDAYITFRYARNLADGAGFVYNPGERVLGTTTPLFTLLMSAFASLHFPLETAARGVAVLADVGILLLLYRFLRSRFGPETGLLSAAVFASLPFSVVASGYGMETQLFSFFLLAAVVAAVEGRRLEAATAAALSALTRPEGFLLSAGLAAAWFLGAARRKERPQWGPAGLFLALVVPWLLFATLYFGNPTPNSLLAKFHQVDVGTGAWASFFFTRNPLLILLWLGALVGGCVGIVRAPRATIPLVAWAVLYPLLFLLGRPPFLGMWYFPPLLPALAGLFAIGVVWVAARLVPRPRLRAALLVTAVCAVVAVGLPRSIETARWSRMLAERVYGPMAAWVSAQTAPEDLIQVSDIGYVGYFSGRRILDSSALVSPEVADYYAAHKDDPAREARYVLLREPRLVILPATGTIVERFVAGGLGDRYRPAARFRLPGRGEGADVAGAATAPRRFEADFIVFERVDRPK